MRFVTRELDVAFNVLEVLYKSKEMWTTQALAEHLSESEMFVYKVIRNLVKTGYCLSAQGPGGGYRIAPHAPSRQVIRLYRDFKFNQNTSELTGDRAASRILNRVLQLLTCLKISDLLTEGDQTGTEPPEAA